MSDVQDRDDPRLHFPPLVVFITYKTPLPTLDDNTVFLRNTLELGRSFHDQDAYTTRAGKFTQQGWQPLYDILIADPTLPVIAMELNIARQIMLKYNFLAMEHANNDDVLRDAVVKHAPMWIYNPPNEQLSGLHKGEDWPEIFPLPTIINREPR